MHVVAQATLWAVLGVGLLLLGVGVATLVRRRVVFPWLRRRDWRLEGCAEVLISLFVIVETVPRLADYSPAVVFALSIAALVPLAAGAFLRLQVQRAH